jgi:hypothetical protein
MNRIEALTEVLNDVTRPESERAIARAALDAARVNATSAPTSDLLQELLLASNKPLPLIPYFEVHSFLSTRGWSKAAREVYDLWLDAYFTTDNGRQDAERIAGYLRKHDLNEFGAALEMWRDSGFKSADRLMRALEVIASSPERGSYHDRATVEECKQFLAEMRRRTAQ